MPARAIAILFIGACLLWPPMACCQATTRIVNPLLDPAKNADLGALHPPEVTAFQIRQYVAKRVQKLNVPPSAEAWAQEASRIRKRMLDEAVFRGWPDEWRDSPLKIEDLGYLPSGKGYRMRKLRYEIVPGMQTTAILYEPEQVKGHMPAMLNVNGHEAEGKAVEYKQKRCINQALNGILALSPEWFFMGELRQPDNTHWFGAHVDLAGRSALGLHYLAMRKALDYLYDHPNVDRKKIGVTGLSGGGWQTMFLSGLDERVALSIPVAGFSSSELLGGIDRIGDNEQSGADVFAIADYAHLVAMMAPRPTLLINNAEDDCCFRAPMVKPYIYDRVRPFFHLYGAEDRFAWHENLDPSTHNYQLENRLMSYAFISKHFGMRPIEKEIPVDDQVRSVKELAVGLPKDNLTLLTLAKKIASEIKRTPVPAAGPNRAGWQKNERDKLEQLLHLRPVEVDRAWMLANTKSKQIESNAFRFDFTNGLSAAGVRFRAMPVPAPKVGTIILNDDGRKASSELVVEGINRGELVVVLDILFTGEAAPPKFHFPIYDRMLTSLGDRTLGIMAAQLLAVSRWIRVDFPSVATIHVQATGMRNQLTALAAAALRPGYFSAVIARKGLPSLSVLLDAPVEYDKSPEVFCPDLYKEFDLDRLAEVAKPTQYSLLDKWSGAVRKAAAR